MTRAEARALLASELARAKELLREARHGSHQAAVEGWKACNAATALIASLAPGGTHFAGDPPSISWSE
jgi:hypothetical protein